ncbi:hypothetical protein MRB53_031851 [Persea americana]|uniref:Uncharacterized protein n=1 Tax=Persea americana TaxID=3435 RepID=A0ACC2KQA1_PERAE|nr:hypothetical protein MRB53_031851 [Persea americana]
MAKSMTALASSAWNLLRLALYWAQKGGIFTGRLMTDVLRNYLKNPHSNPHNSIYYGVKEFPFDDTPCLTPRVIVRILHDEDEKSLYRRSLEEDYEGGGDRLNDDKEKGSRKQQGEDGIDSKAEEFIERFYEQIKLQRQVSYLQYMEMLQRRHHLNEPNELSY